MRKKVCGLLLIALSQTAAGGNIHQDAAQCRLSSALNEVCWNNCVQCHDNTNPIVPLDIYVNGDVELCEQCHPEKSIQETGKYLLHFVGGGGGNHPVAIFYSPEGSRTVLVPSPVGPKIFTDKDGNNPKVHCSTCHDAMSSAVNLLRVDNRRSALCLACHIK